MTHRLHFAAAEGLVGTAWAKHSGSLRPQILCLGSRSRARRHGWTFVPLGGGEGEFVGQREVSGPMRIRLTPIEYL